MDPVTTSPSKKPSKWNLYYAAISANLLFISHGCSLTWSSPAIPLLRERGMKPNQETWMVSLLLLGACFGPSIFDICIDRLGRKKSMLLTSAIYLLSWLILGVSNNVYSLCIGRFIGGLGIGASLNCIPVYISEVSDSNMRQSLSSMTEFFVSIGCLIEYGVGPFLNYINLVLVSVIPTVLFAVAIIRVPESPYHLIACGKREEALTVLKWFRGCNQNLQEEIEQIELSVKQSTLQSGSRIDLIRQKGPRKALLVSGLMFIVLPFTAIDVIASYMGPILSGTSLPISSHTATVIVGAMDVIFSAAEPFIVHRFGSKWTYVICSVLCAFFLMLFGTYRYFDEHHYDVSHFNAIPIICITLFDLCYVLGIGAIPWSISAELFPPSLKGFAINVVTTEHWVVDFIIVNMFGYLEPVIGASICFISFSAVLIIGTVLIAIVLPDTKGLALHQIHDDLKNS